MKSIDIRRLLIVVGTVAGVLILAVFVKFFVIDPASENSRLKAALSEKEAALAEKTASLEAAHLEMAAKDSASSELNREIQKLKQSVAMLEARNEELESDTKAQDELRELRLRLDELEKSESASKDQIAELQKRIESISKAKATAYTYPIASFTTGFTYADAGRVANLTVASRSISGSIIMPGEVFSFFDVVGECTVPKGYRESKIFLQGEIAEGIGGGICQVSSTLYNAALLSGMKITERHAHSMKVSYVQPGRDATVSYGYLDLKFSNPYDHPVKIIADMVDGKLTFTFYCEHKMIKSPDVKIDVIAEDDGGYTMIRKIDGKADYQNKSYYKQ